MSEEEQEADDDDDDGKDCFGVDQENERDSGMDKGADFQARAAAELDDLLRTKTKFGIVNFAARSLPT
eukprot:772939-Pelagomonas_calceolata.AAC.1